MKKSVELILGHNSFFGVDHLSQSSGDNKDKLFENDKNIQEVLQYCNDKGISSMMMSSHERAQKVIDIINSNNKLKDWKIYPLLPYVQKYVRKSNELGLHNLILDLISKTSFKQKFNMLMKGSKGLVTKDINELIPILIDLEMTPFKNNNLGAVFLHDALVDLAIGIGADKFLITFKNHIENNYNTKAGFITKNVKLFVERMNELAVKDYYIMASFNKMGFFVNPDLQTVSDYIIKNNIDLIPMSVIASGALKPEEAFEYLSKFHFSRIILGMTKKNHIDSNLLALKKHYNI